MATLLKRRFYANRSLLLVIFLGTACHYLPTLCQAQKLQSLPTVGQPIVGTLTTEETDLRGVVLTAGPQRTVAMRPMRDLRSQYWTLAPVGRDTVRLQLFEAGTFWSLAVDVRTGGVGFVRSDQKREQLWRITQSLAVPGALRFESLGVPGFYLAGDANSSVGVSIPSTSPAQNWYFDVSPPPPTVVIPVQRLLQQTIQPNPPLAPVPTRLINSDTKEVLVRVTDLRTGAPFDVTIPPKRAKDLVLDRDSGATFVETYEVIDGLGNSIRREFSTPVPPAPLYDITVYEKFLQSIAIDRTGKSPNKIEDINYQPKSIGLFMIPPGAEFRGGDIDVYQSAKKANNPGAARRVNPNVFNNKTDTDSDPLENALRGLRGR